MYVHMVGRDEESRGGGEVCIIPVLAILSEHRDCIDRISIDFDYEEVGELPELGGICDFDDLLAVNIDNLIRVFWLRSHNLGFLAVCCDFAEVTLVAGSEVAHVEISLHHLGLAQESRFEYVSFLEFFVSADSIVAGVEFTVCGKSSFFSCGFGCAFGLYVGLKRVNVGIKALDC